MEARAESMRVVLSADQRYVVPLAVTLASISHFHEPGDVRATVMSGGISTQDQVRIRRSAPTIDIEFFSINQLFEGKYSRYGNSQPRVFYGRLVGLDYLSQYEQRAIYLDSDTIVRSSLRPLFDVNLETFAVGAISKWTLAPHT